MKELQVKDLMSELVLSVRENEKLDVVYDMMSENHIRHIPVVDVEGTVIGLLSQRDLIGSALFSEKALPVGEVQELFRAMRVREIMVREVETVEAETNAGEAARIMFEN